MAASSTAIKLVVGLGNPGAEYCLTRHNAGQDFVERLATSCGSTLIADKKYFGRIASVALAGYSVRLLIPDTYMNRSGKSVAALANFFKIEPSEILVVYDELDLPAGVARLKFGGGSGGHNGLKSIMSSLANNRNFARLRLGIDHPGHAGLVSSYVLGRPSPADRDKLDRAMDKAFHVLPYVVAGDWQKAMLQLHSN